MKNPFTSAPFKSVMGVLLQVAPTAASLLPGGTITAPLAKLAISKLAIAVKKPMDAPAQEVADAISQTTDPKDLLAIKQADDELQTHLADLGISAESLQVDDRESARQYAISTSNAIQRPMLWWLLGFTSIFSLAFVSFLFLYGGKVSEAILTAAIPVGTTIVNSCWTEIKAAYAFAFGGSQDKAAVATAVNSATK